ncbi:MAG: DUF2798 domain-containing protein [Rickettsiales bacterium]
MMFTPIRRARLTYVVVMALSTCFIMSGVSTYVLAPNEFSIRWPHVFLIDVLVAIPVAIVLGPFVRKLCHRLYPEISK